jgi:biopolymer transport protein ExbD
MLLRKLFGRKNQDEDGVWKLPTSMIDVVFLLLIFFMCASKFRVLEQRMDAFLPRDRDHDRRRPPAVIDTQIPIQVSTHPSSPAVPQYRIHRWVTNDPNALAAHLMRFPGAAQYEVVIDGDQNVPFRHVMSAVDAAARARMTKVTFRPPPITSG